MAINAKQRREQAEAFVRGKTGEPIVTKDNYREDLINALNWYNLNCDDKDMLKYAEQYLKKMGMLKEYSYCISRASYLELKTVGTLGRLVVRDQYVDLDHIERALTDLVNLKKKYVKVAQVVTSATGPVPLTIQERMAESASTFASEIDGEIDNFVKEKKSEFSAKGFLVANQVAGPIAKKIGELYKPMVKELEQAIEGEDEQLKEGYGHFTKPQLKKFMVFIQSIVDDCLQQTVSARAQRKPRARKIKPASVIVKKIKYMKEFPELKLTSIDPAKIVNSSELWVYVPEKRKLIVYYAADSSGLGVSGMSITNYDVAKSEVKTLRKPEEFFKGLSFGKRAMANAWKSVRAKTSSPRARINEEMILLAAN
jgi:hypothetical protein